MHGNPPIGKYLLKMGEFPDYRKVISFSQKELLEKLLTGKEEAAICLQKMNVGQWDEDFQKYVNWKCQSSYITHHLINIIIKFPAVTKIPLH